MREIRGRTLELIDRFRNVFSNIISPLFQCHQFLLKVSNVRHVFECKHIGLCNTTIGNTVAGPKGTKGAMAPPWPVKSRL